MLNSIIYNENLLYKISVFPYFARSNKFDKE